MRSIGDLGVVCPGRDEKDGDGIQDDELARSAVACSSEILFKPEALRVCLSMEDHRAGNTYAAMSSKLFVKRNIQGVFLSLT